MLFGWVVKYFLCIWLCLCISRCQKCDACWRLCLFIQEIFKHLLGYIDTQWWMRYCFQSRLVYVSVEFSRFQKIGLQGHLRPWIIWVLAPKTLHMAPGLRSKSKDPLHPVGSVISQPGICWWLPLHSFPVSNNEPTTITANIGDHLVQPPEALL